MHHFIMFLETKNFRKFIGFFAAYHFQVGSIEVRQADGYRFAVLIHTAQRITNLKLAFDLQDTRRKQAFPLLLIACTAPSSKINFPLGFRT